MVQPTISRMKEVALVRRVLLVFVVMAVMLGAMAVPAFANASNTFYNPHANPTTGKPYKQDTPQMGYVDTSKAYSADSHARPITDPSGGNPGRFPNRCAGPINGGPNGVDAC